MLEDDVSKCPLEETLRRRFREKVQTYVSCPASPGSLSMGLNLFFGGAGLLKSDQKQQNEKFRLLSPVQPLLGSSAWV